MQQRDNEARHDRRSQQTRPGNAVARCLATFVIGSIAQGAPFVLVAAALQQRGAGPAWLAATAAVRLLPYLLCSPVAGALAGRFEPRLILAVTALGRGALVVALGIALWVESPAVVPVLLLFVLVAFGTPAFPALMRAVRDTAPASGVERASAVAAGLESAAFCAGPALGGLLLVAGAARSLLVCAALMGVSAGLAASLPARGETSTPAGGRSSRPIRTAGRWLLGPGIRPALVAVVGVNVLAGLDAALLARLPAELGLGGEPAFGLLSFVHGVGALGAFVALLRTVPRGRRPLVPLATAGAAVAVLGVAGHLSVALVACCVVGASILTAEVLATGTLGRSLPRSLVAPAFGLLDALMVAAMIAGATVAPSLSAAFGLRPALALAGVGTPVLAVCSLYAARQRGRRGSPPLAVGKLAFVHPIGRPGDQGAQR